MIKEQRKAYSKRYYQHNREKIIVQNTAYKQANPEKTRTYNLALYHIHKERNKGKRARYRQVNREKIRVKDVVYYYANIERIRDKRKLYRQANPEIFSYKTRKRHALKMGAQHEPYEDIHIFERDNWICGICGLKINKRLRFPNLLSKSIDHIIPLIRGGADAPINLQATHLICNVGKQARSGGQLRLIG